MFGECHAHIFMNGKNYREAVKQHSNGVDREDVQRKLEKYKEKNILFIRDGGDHLGVSEYAAQIAGTYGITYRTPVFAIHKNGHYGKIVGKGFDTMKEYSELVQEVRERKGDFIKIMISGIMDFGKEGQLTEAPLSGQEIKEMIHIAHEEGFAVMAHANGAEAVIAASQGGVDSVEHGNFLNEDAILAMKENQTIWVPTYVTIANLIGSGRFDDIAIKRLKERQGQMIRRGYEAGVMIALGSDAGAFCVPHCEGIADEARELTALFGDENEVRKCFEIAENTVKMKFCAPL